MGFVGRKWHTSATQSLVFLLTPESVAMSRNEQNTFANRSSQLVWAPQRANFEERRKSSGVGPIWTTWCATGQQEKDRRLAEKQQFGDFFHLTDLE